MKANWLKVIDLKKTYQVRRGIFGSPHPLHAVRGVSFDVDEASTFGLVGESGSGKTTIAKMLMLAEAPTSGSIELNGNDILSLDDKSRKKFHLELQPVLQDPYSSLNPRMRISQIIEEPLRIHGIHKTREEYSNRVQELLRLVGLPPEVSKRYPHELSGGQRQRVSIGRALGVNPHCIILDEPVSALDVSVQAQILNLLKDLQVNLALTYLLISHDLAVIAYMSKRIGVLYLGEFMEIADTDDIVNHALHPYTQTLIAAVDSRSGTSQENVIDGEIPSPMKPPSGCPFHPRCNFIVDRCRTEKPILRNISPSHKVACHRAEEINSLLNKDNL